MRGDDMAGWGEGCNAWPAWSPDGTRIAVERFATGSEWGTSHVVDVDGTGLRRLTDFPGSFNGWSPSGAQIALTGRTLPAAPDIFVVGADGSDLRNVTNARLSEYLRDVRRGEVFLVTDRDEVPSCPRAADSAAP